MNYVKVLLIRVLLFLGVGFLTLVERKVLSYIQARKGPNKIGLLGVLQPLRDAAKLFTKELSKLNLRFTPSFYGGPVFGVIVILTLWFLYFRNFNIRFNWGIIFFLRVSSLNVFSLLLSGWARSSKYALLGRVRASAQTISYEVILALALLCIILFLERFRVQNRVFWISLLSPAFLGLWLICIVAETNRAPFDLAEGERELVSGFNIEYGGSRFAFLFIAEYGSILFISMITASLFFNSQILGLLGFRVIILWIRGSFPRIRYDSLMHLCWKTLLRITLRVRLIVFLF